MSFKLVDIGDICTTTQGVQISKSETSDSPFKGGYRYLYIADFLSDKNLSFVADKFDSKKVSVQDLVMANTGSPGRVFKGKDGILSNNLFKISFDTNVVDRDYLYLVLSSSDFQTKLQQQMKGGIQKHLGHKTISRQKIPLPPLAEQQRISAILDSADSLRQKDQQLVERYTALSQSLFLEMFGDPVTNSKGWDLSNLEECLNGICGGTSVGGEERNIKAGEKAVLKISAVTSGSFDPMQYKVVEMQDVPENPISPKTGDLLFSRANTRDLVGATCIVDRTYENLFLPDKLWRLDLKPAKAANWYIKFLLTHDGFRENLRKVATGTSGSMLNISKGKLQQLKIPLPSVGMQNQFAERIQLIEAQKQQAQQSLEKSEALFNSLLQRAFTGELTAKMVA